MAAASNSEDWARTVVVPGQGDGTLARIGPVVLLVGSSDPDVVKPYLEHAQMVAANGGQGRQLVRGYALMLSTAVEESPGFAALAPHSTGLAVFVDGDVTVTVDDEQISGADSLAWVERLIPWPVGSVRVSLPGTSAPEATSTFRLDAGVVPAGSLTIAAAAVEEAPVPAAPAAEVAPPVAAESTPAEPTPAEPIVAEVAQPVEPSPATPADLVWEKAEPAAAETPEPPAPAAAPPAPEPPAAPVAAAPPTPPAPPTPAAGRPLPPAPADEQVSFQSVLLDDVEDMDDFEPLPIVEDASQIKEEISREQVRGVYCKNRHFNDPRVLFCTVCGINMVQQTPVLVDGPRPPLGVIVLDDGSVFQLDTPYLLGRDPATDPRIESGGFRPLPIIDQSNQVSRVHARLEMRGWDVVLIDNDSTNGTFVHVPKTADWARMAPGAEQVLLQGTRIRIGHRTLAFNTHGGESRR